MRKLASIQKIKSLEPIAGADLIEKATVLGWHLVVKKGEFNEGDYCIFCEPDSILPDKPEFEFLRSRGMRIKTMRLRGQVSQGIAFPLSILPGGDFTEDQDVTDYLGITKYEPPVPACLKGIFKGPFPSFIPKTDETRVQVLQHVLDKYEGEKCYVTEKLDGNSTTYYIKDGVFGVCSRNMDLFETPDNLFWKVARELDIENKLRSLNNNYTLQGELIGEGIQGNKYKRKGHTVKFFNLFDINSFRYASYTEFTTVLTKLDLPIVPVIENDFKLINNIDELVKYATIKSRIKPDIWAEGIIIRPLIERVDMILSDQSFRNGRVTFKVINPEFLIKYEA